MPEERSGSTLWNRPRTKASAQVRVPALGGKKKCFPMPNSSASDEVADERRKVVNEVAQRMTTLDAPTSLMLLKRIAAAPLAKLRVACAGADEFIGGYRPPSSAATVREVGKQWTGDYEVQGPDYGRQALHEKHPLEVGEMDARVAKHTDELLEKWVYPAIGKVPVDEVTLDVADLIKAALAKSDLEHNSQRNVLAKFRRLMSMCVYPLKLIKESPLPKGWVPPAAEQKAFGMLYSDDDEILLGCTAVSIHWRMFWGFLSHEGVRLHMAVEMNIEHVDFVHNAVRFDKTKTRVPLVFAFTDGTGEGLQAYLRRYRPNAKPKDPLFVDDKGKRIRLPPLAQIFRKHLRIAGIDKRRPELFEESDYRTAIRAYDQRGSFVTVKLAIGWTPNQVTEHTGHLDDDTLRYYTRASDTYKSLRLKQRDFVPLIAAIPELQTSPDGNGPEPGAGQSTGNRLASTNSNHAISLAKEKFSQDFVLGSQPRDMAQKPKIMRLALPSSPVQPDAPGQTLATPEAAGHDEHVRRLELELLIEREAGKRALAMFSQALAQVNQTMVPQMSEAVMRELAARGVVERARPQLVKGDDDNGTTED